jgi:2-amino-4-hydroxy-6-hydroxymethyldihydropteridine diphosphokinase
MSDDRIQIVDLLVRAVVGLHDHERRGKQDVLISATLHTDLRAVGASDRVERGVNYATVARAIIAHVEASHRYTIEALATDVAGIVLSFSGVERAGVRVSKPGAERYAKAIAVEIERTRADLVRMAHIVLGSNLDPERNLPRAAAMLDRIGEVLAFSPVFQSPAEDARDQPDYLNAASALRTTLPAAEVRRRLKEIERECGRGRENGRGIAVDLDLCLLGEEVIDAPDVRLPHPSLTTRACVPAVLARLDPALSHPVTRESLAALSARLAPSLSLRERPDVRLVPPGNITPN